MKRCVMLIAGITLILGAITACSKAERGPDLDARKKLQFEIEVQSPSGSSTGTKAARTSWVVGDKMILFFNRQLGDEQQAELLYDGSIWKITFKSQAYMNGLPSKGTIDAIYYDGGDIIMRQPSADHRSDVISDCANKIRLQAEKMAYSNEGGVFTSTLKMEYYRPLVMITVRGLQASDGWSFYTDVPEGISYEPFYEMTKAYITPNTLSSLNSHAINQYHPVPLMNNEEGASCYLELDAEASEQVEKYVFYLKKGGVVYRKTFLHKIIPPCEIVLDGPEPGNLHGWE